MDATAPVHYPFGTGPCSTVFRTGGPAGLLPTCFPVPRRSLPVPAAVAHADVQPLHVFAWIVDSGLRDSLKALAHSILRRVDRNTWRWPRRHGSLGGVTVADLADGAGLSRRHAARCLRTLEDKGLVRTTFRPFDVSEYELLPSAWKTAAERHRARRSAEKQRTREARIRRFNERREAARVRAAEAAAPTPAALAPQETDTAPLPLPRWAVRHGRRVDAPSETVFGLVGGAAAAILGDTVDRRAQGGFARPVLKLWDARGRPQADQLCSELALLAQWARESVHPDAVSLRGAGRQAGPDRSTDPRTLCAPADFEQRLALARSHASPPGAVPASTAAPEAGVPRVPGRSDPPWVPPGQGSFLPGMAPRGDLDDAWDAALSHLRRDADQDLGAIDIFLTPLRPLRVEHGVVVLAAPSADSARWIASHLTDALSVLAQSLGAPVGLVRLD